MSRNTPQNQKWLLVEIASTDIADLKRRVSVKVCDNFKYFPD
jgi:hypothetical protein